MSDRHRGWRADEGDRHRQESDRRRTGGTPIPGRGSSLSRLNRNEGNIHRTRRDDTSQAITRLQPKPEKTEVFSGQRRIQPRDNAPSLARPTMTTGGTGRREDATRAQRGDNGNADTAGDSEPDDTRGRSPGRDRSSTRRTQSDDDVTRKGYRRRSSSGRRDRNRSVSRTRRFSGKVGKALGYKSRPRGIDDQVVSLRDGEDNSIVYGKQGEKQIQARATVIERGSWQGWTQTALYFRVQIKMVKLHGVNKVDATFEFRRHGDTSGDRLPIFRSSPRRLYGIRQPVNEDYGNNTQFGAQAGTEATNVNVQRDNTRAMNLSRDHLPILQVTEMNHTLAVSLFKSGEMCSLESEFSVQIVVPYDRRRGVDVSCDITADSMEVRGIWRKIKIDATDMREEDYYRWDPETWQKNGDCEGFHKNVSIW